MHAAGDNSGLGTLVPVIVSRLPAILTEVRELLADEHPDYAGFIDTNLHEVLASAQGSSGA